MKAFATKKDRFREKMLLRSKQISDEALDKQQVMIDRAVKHLAAMKQDEDMRLFNQQAEKRAAEDAKEERRRNLHEAVQDSIHQSRQKQLRAKQKAVDDKEELGRRMLQARVTSGRYSYA